ncbi:hypothetical protein CY34DRAFT_811754 [Suillus luteus UH-Slu-Lm8-n1]|uniref:Uncharacterized protein n=1 Tax=Suillus luteus UH-Slu-Lm8-n1 TaxID=930992 RepID=A0A0D0ANP7_9AGAM|nr:hypothetical protein CY34DRAFT_811754 [Suillus luteus UH-Slu-Lm8-n1]
MIDYMMVHIRPAITPIPSRHVPRSLVPSRTLALPFDDPFHTSFEANPLKSGN